MLMLQLDRQNTLRDLALAERFRKLQLQPRPCTYTVEAAKIELEVCSCVHVSTTVSPVVSCCVPPLIAGCANEAPNPDDRLTQGSQRNAIICSYSPAAFWRQTC